MPVALPPTGTVRGRARLVRALPTAAASAFAVPIAVALALVLVAARPWLVPTAALGHAGELRSSPADGERLEASPPALTIDFTEPVGISTDAVRLVDATGAKITLQPATREGSRVTQALPPLGDGWYLATWSIVSQDGHVVHGAAAFAVGDADGPPPGDSGVEVVAAATGVVRGLADFGLLATLGSIGAWLVLGGRSPRVRQFTVLAAVGGAAGGLGIVAVTWIDAGTAALGAALVPAAAARTVLLGLAAGAVVAGRWWPAATAAALSLVAAFPGGHPGSAAATAVLLLAHLLAGALWLGAAPAVLIVLADRRVDDAGAETVVRRFSRLATVTLAIVAGAGIALAIALTNALAPGVDPRYLVFLGAKVLLVGLAALAGAATRRALGRGPVPRRRLVRLFAADVVALVLVVAASAGLAAGAPRDAHATEGAGIHVGHCTVETASGLASLTLVPGRVGVNTFYLDGAGPAEDAVIELRRPGDEGAVEVTTGSNGAGWAGTGAVPVAGTWAVTVAVGRDAFTVERVSCQLLVEP